MVGIRRVVLVWAACLAGCLEPRLIPCGDKVCAPDAVCIAANQCASQDAVDVCRDLVDGTVCRTTLFDGTCVNGACVAAHCGDGIKSGSEQCDGLVTDHDCVEFGFDVGIPACNDRCDLDLINTCTRFGWTREIAVPVTAAWADGSGRYLFTRYPDEVVEYHTGSSVIVDDTQRWTAVRGNATLAVVFNLYNLAISTGGPFENVGDIPSLPNTITDAVIADDGTIYAMDGYGATHVARREADGSWTSILEDPANPGAKLYAHGTDLYVGLDSGEVRRWDGTSWHYVVTAPSEVTGMLVVGTDLYLTTYSNGLFRWTGTTLETFLDRTVTSMAYARGYVWATDNFGLTYRFDGDLLETLQPPIYGDLFSDRLGNLYSYNNGIYQFTGIDWATHEGLPGVTTDMALLRDGTVAVSDLHHVYRRTNDNDWRWDYVYGNIVAIAGAGLEDYYVFDGTTLFHWNGTTFIGENPSGFDISGVSRLWMPPSGEPSLYAVGPAGLILARTNTTWAPQTPPPGTTGCDVAGISGGSLGVYAVGACGTQGFVWKQEGASWTEVYRGGTPLLAVTITLDDEVFAVGPGGGVHFSAGQWSPEPRAQGTTVSSTLSNDVFVGGGPNDVMFWNGQQWSRLGIVGATQPRVVATPHAVYFGGAAQSVLVRD